MKLVAISDTHTQHERIKIPVGDILIHCGDFSNTGEEDETLEFLDWLQLQTKAYKKVLFISGNHDFRVDNFEEKIRSHAPDVVYLHDESYTFEGVKFYGFPHVPALPNWAYTLARGKQMKSYTDCIPECDVLISHGPPFGILDMVERRAWDDYEDPDGKWRVTSFKNVGCTELLERVQKIKPKVHFFGHIHEGYGKYVDKNTTFVNCSVLNRSYKIQNDPQVIEI